MKIPTRTSLTVAAIAQTGLDEALASHGVCIKSSAVPKIASNFDHLACLPEWETALLLIVDQGGPAAEIAQAALDLRADRIALVNIPFQRRLDVAVSVLASQALIPSAGNITVHMEHAKGCPKGRGEGEECICRPEITLTDQRGFKWSVDFDGWPTKQKGASRVEGEVEG